MPSRLLRRARASPPPARLVLAVKETIQGGLRESMHVDWMEPQLYRRVVQGSLGALVMYQAGAKPHPDDYEDAYTEALDRLVTTRGSPAQSFGEFKPTLRPPSLSALCRWLHSAMRGRDTFDLQALLTEAAAYEEASRLAGRVLSAHYGAMEAFVMQLQLLEHRQHEDMDEQERPADARAASQVHNAFHRLQSMRRWSSSVSPAW